MTVSDEKLLALFSDKDTGQVFKIRFTDGTEEEIMDCCVLGDPGNRECTATIVRTDAGSLRSAGQAILFGFDEVADVEPSKRGFDHYR
jgi:hypothetical protein